VAGRKSLTDVPADYKSSEARGMIPRIIPKYIFIERKERSASPSFRLKRALIPINRFSRAELALELALVRRVLVLPDLSEVGKST